MNKRQQFSLPQSLMALLRFSWKFCQNYVGEQRRFINTIRFITAGLSQYDVDVCSVPPLIVQQAVHFNELPQHNANSLLFYVRRTHPGKLLPIQLECSHGLTRKTTTIGRIDGDSGALLNELETFIPRDRLGRSPITGDIKIKGDYKTIISQYLTLRGF